MLKTTKKALAEHLARVHSTIIIGSKTDKQNIAILEKELDDLSKRHSTLVRLRIFVFILLYASVASAVSAGLPVLGEISQTIAYIAGMAGVSILSLLAIYLTWRMGQLINQILMLYSHIIAIYEKHNKTVLQKA